MKRLLMLFLIGVGAFFGLLFVGVLLGGKTSTKQSWDDGIVGSGSATQRNSHLATMDEFLALKNGMSYAEACKIIGSPGELISSGHVDGVPGVMNNIDTLMYQWKGQGIANMNAMFQNDKLITKAQFGLK